MKTMASLIREHLFMVGIDENYIETVAGCARNVVYSSGTYIFREGSIANAFFLIREGHVALEVYAPQLGNRVVQTLGPQEILGEAWLVPPYVHDFDARATDDNGFVNARLITIPLEIVRVGQRAADEPQRIGR